MINGTFCIISLWRGSPNRDADEVRHRHYAVDVHILLLLYMYIFMHIYIYIFIGRVYIEKSHLPSPPPPNKSFTLRHWVLPWETLATLLFKIWKNLIMDQKWSWVKPSFNLYSYVVYQNTLIKFSLLFRVSKKNLRKFFFLYNS